MLMCSLHSYVGRTLAAGDKAKEFRVCIKVALIKTHLQIKFFLSFNSRTNWRNFSTFSFQTTALSTQHARHDVSLCIQTSCWILLHISHVFANCEVAHNKTEQRCICADAVWSQGNEWIGYLIGDRSRVVLLVRLVPYRALQSPVSLFSTLHTRTHTCKLNLINKTYNVVRQSWSCTCHDKQQHTWQQNHSHPPTLHIKLSDCCLLTSWSRTPDFCSRVNSLFGGVEAAGWTHCEV